MAAPPVQTSLDAPLETATSTELVPTTEQTIITTNAEGKRVKKIIRKKRRPARPQVDPATLQKQEVPQTGNIYNVWYNKWYVASLWLQPSLNSWSSQA
jgi:hypothetical protein